MTMPTNSPCPVCRRMLGCLNKGACDFAIALSDRLSALEARSPVVANNAARCGYLACRCSMPEYIERCVACKTAGCLNPAMGWRCKLGTAPTSEPTPPPSNSPGIPEGEGPCRDCGHLLHQHYESGLCQAGKCECEGYRIVPVEPPAKTERAVCPEWCGEEARETPVGAMCWTAGGDDDPAFCSAQCSALMEPRNPAKVAKAEAAQAAEARPRRPYDETLDTNETGPAGQALDCHGKCVECGERPREPGVSVPSCLCGVKKQAAEPSAPAGFRVAGQSGPGIRLSGGQWWRRRPDGPPQRTGVPRSQWDAGCYDILEPVAEPAAPPVTAKLSEPLVTEADVHWAALADELQTALDAAKTEATNLRGMLSAALEAEIATSSHLRTRDARIAGLEASAAVLVREKADLEGRLAASEHDVAALRARLHTLGTSGWVRAK